MGELRRRTFSHALALVLGFTLVFTALGASVGFVGYLLYDIKPLLVRVGSVLLVVLGLRLAQLRWRWPAWFAFAAGVGLLTYWLDKYQLPTLRYLDAGIFAAATLAGGPWPLAGHVALAVVVAVLNGLTSITVPALRVLESGLMGLTVLYGSRTDLFEREFRVSFQPQPGRSYWTSFLVGVVFAAGWTPCVGPILAAILIMAGTQASAGQGALLLAAYSAGLGIPFLLTGGLFSWVTGLLPKVRRRMGVVSLLSSLLLILIAAVLFTDTLRSLAQIGFIVNVEDRLAANVTGGQIPLLFAFIAGLASFVSPCVLPLVPAYVGYLGGAAVGQMSERREVAA